MRVLPRRIGRSSHWVIALAACASCTRAGDDSEARLAAAKPYLAPAAQSAAEILRGTRRCESPLPSFPACEHDHGQVLLLAGDIEGGAGRRVPALLFVPPGRDANRAMTMWHFDSLGAALGHGWYQVTATSHVD
jgi:hypothetical protein